MAPRYSVIITTYNRWDKLANCLDHLARQSVAREQFEVLVVDDGSSTEPSEPLAQWGARYPLTLRTWRIANSGQGNARHYALQEAQGEIILFIGDDIYVSPEWLASHAAVHDKYPAENIGVLGMTTWAPNLEVSPFMYWLEHGGHQFKYGALARRPEIDSELHLREADFWFFYTSNISLKRSLLRQDSFSTTFKAYGWEDIELGYRLQQRHGFKLYYQARAVAGHDHVMSESELVPRMQAVGRSAVLFQRLYPEVPVVARGVKKIIFDWLTARWLKPWWRWVKHWGPRGKQIYWYVEMKRAFAEGTKS